MNGGDLLNVIKKQNRIVENREKCHTRIIEKVTEETSGEEEENGSSPIEVYEETQDLTMRRVKIKHRL